MKRNPVAWAALVVSTAALVSSSGALRRMPAAPNVPAEGQKTAQALSQAFEAVADFVRPSVVQVTVTKKAARVPNLRNFPFPGPNGRPNPNAPNNPKDLEELLKRFFGPDGMVEPQQFGRQSHGTGSGFVYDNRGHILTNNHVVEGAEKITVTFHDGIEAAATVVGTDSKSDVAVIKVDVTNYPALPRGDSSKLKVGDLVMAVGSPFELSQSVTTGIISATERNDVQINEFESFIQTDASINPGNSGGPLVNMNGEVIGVNSAIVTGGRGNDGIGFAIPIDMASGVADQLVKDGKVRRARIGVQMAPLTPVLARQLGLDPTTKGILVSEVKEGSPADKAGLKQGDVIVGFAGDKITSMPSFRLKVATSPLGKGYEIEYFRDGKRQTATITPAPYEDVVFDMEKQRGSKDGGESQDGQPKSTAIGEFGLEVQPLTADLAKSLGLPAGATGLLVSEVKDNSPAEAEGIKEGDLITKVVKDRKIQPLKTVKEFQDLASKSNELSFYVQTGKDPGRFVTLAKAKK
ncbi:Periplasmic pH-dependent serine endoprotease DegQ precursor [Aquisphaera giovannonii]|uniref:Periplasmic pH-dependent serine endoprotease DegQ n=1 Tax=Aquisphaera giovannonii TaxID=406548 RepID=A0A5B9VZJ9_9BACT|nr:trypsin-like peptidase domain-containing protein [Aquisphaera giovannonii]QEH33100.1 Periplasmic pH-dependent serine endoprotease DegQ precursor [Aquisphaera giovannonii]